MCPSITPPWCRPLFGTMDYITILLGFFYIWSKHQVGGQRTALCFQAGKKWQPSNKAKEYT